MPGTQPLGPVVIAALIGVLALAVPAFVQANSPAISFLASQLRVGEVVRTRVSNLGPQWHGYTWYTSSDKTDWTSIKWPNSNNDYYGSEYTPTAQDQGKYLRVVFDYGPIGGPKEELEAVSAGVVGARAAAPRLEVTELVTGLSIPWDLAFAPDGTLLFTERGGTLKARLTDGTVQTVTADMSDLWVKGNTGLMSIVVDPSFATNRRFYTCQAHTDPKEIQVIAWTINAAYDTATRADDPLVGGLPRNDLGGHAGCRLRFGLGGSLWIATGDAAQSDNPQDKGSLGGKVLRVNAATGNGHADNPFTSPSSPLIYSYGHRNPQGLARRPGTSQMWSVEHGPNHDDEINLLSSGGNYGWHPRKAPDDSTYDEESPMTDLTAFPNAIEAKWSSGTKTVATSGSVFLDGDWWGAWQGRLAVATLAQQVLLVIKFASDGAFESEIQPGGLDLTYGRLRTPMIGPDKALYLTTSNSTSTKPNADKILKVVPRWLPALTGPTSPSYQEGGTDPVATYSITGRENLTWSLSGSDADDFTISSGVLRFQTSPDYDNPTDSDLNNVYTLTVKVSDGTHTDWYAVTVTVTERPQPPPDNGGNGGGGGGGGGGSGQTADRHGNAPETATAIAVGSSTPGQINARSDRDYFTLAVPQAGLLVVETSGSTDTQGSLTTPDGQVLAQADTGGTRRNFQLTQHVTPGSYLVAVTGTRTGNYRLEVDLIVGFVDNPQPDSAQSGIGVLSGWVCEAETVEVELNGELQEAAYGTERTDTINECGDTDNGFGLLHNWNKLGDGEHLVRVWVDGIAFATLPVTVTTLGLGVEFPTGLQGEATLADFPSDGESVRLVWQEAQQNFALAEGPVTQSGTTRDWTWAVLGNPAPGSYQSGIRVISGWVCEAEEVVLEIDGVHRLEAAYGTERADTLPQCGDTNNGFGLLWNWNKLADGPHTIRLLVDGEEWATAAFTVTTLGEEFRRGLTGRYTITAFPGPGEAVTVEWQEAQQNFVVTGVGD